MTDSVRDRIARVIDKALNGDCGYGVGEHLADVLLATFPWLADGPSDVEVEAGARALRESEMVREDTWYAPWDELTDRAQDERRDVVRAVLVAAREARAT